jgi:drug/metabolite transporter superfamily protein YnfA
VKSAAANLIWMWLKQKKSIVYAIAGGVILICCGIVATWQTASFGKTIICHLNSHVVQLLPLPFQRVAGMAKCYQFIHGNIHIITFINASGFYKFNYAR